MDTNMLREIVAICLRMDENAVKIYKCLSKETKNSKLSKFLAHMALEESQHVICWKDILSLVEEGFIPQVFNEPEAILKELNGNLIKLEKLTKQISTLASISEIFVLAFRLEFYLLHPAFGRLWYFYGIIRNNKYNPWQEYENHIHKFIISIRKLGAATIEIEALGEALEQMWSNVKNIAIEANTDELTKILNRRGFFNAMTSSTYLAKRNGFYSVLLMIDLDNFKLVNNTKGHLVGDKVLKDVAKIIRNNIRGSDILGRFGGEEFIIFLPQIEKKSIKLFAEKIRKAVQRETTKTIPVTVSIGCYGKQIKGIVEDEVQELIKQADILLYEAKEQGRNKVIC